MPWRPMAAVAAGGAIGALVRVGVVLALPHQAAAWPWSTFAVNLAGSFLLGYGATRLDERLPLSSYRRPLLATGICGALTTFSTLQIELLRMLDAGRQGLAAGYALASLSAGLVAVWSATALARGLLVRR
jgi:fluoride exporter